MNRNTADPYRDGAWRSLQRRLSVKIATNHITKTHFVVNFAGCQMEIIIDAILIRVSLPEYPPISNPVFPHTLAQPHRQLMLRLMRCTRGKRLNNSRGFSLSSAPPRAAHCAD